MPELPDIVVYQASLASRIVGAVLERIRIQNAFVLRSAVPPITSAESKTVREVTRLGKRLVIGLDGDLFLVIHLMRAGRLRWGARSTKLPGRLALAAFDFSSGTLILTEAGTKRRASLHLVAGRAALAGHDPGGLEVLEASREAFAARLRSENHTLKRALTSPALFSGIGGAYSDEIMFRARLSPIALTGSLDDAAIGRLYESVRSVLTEWTERLRREAGDEFPEHVTAFRPEMAVHGRYGKPCPECGTPVQRIVYADTETNYCARCQTAGRILADRALSRLLHRSWPRTVDELE